MFLNEDMVKVLRKFLNENENIKSFYIDYASGSDDKGTTYKISYYIRNTDSFKITIEVENISELRGF